MDSAKINQRLQSAASGRLEQFSQAKSNLERLLSIMADLRSPGGCPWDAEQSLASLRQYVREEADEVCEAIDNILAFEDELRTSNGMSGADPTPPEQTDQARNARKGHTIAHHPHRPDFNSLNSASGAPLPVELSSADKARLDSLYAALFDEMGDVMLQGAFLGEILTAMGRGGLERGLNCICEKLIRRHPHVYGDREVSGSAEVLNNWESIKKQERSR